MTAALLLTSDAGAFAWLYFQCTASAHLATGVKSVRYFEAGLSESSGNCASRIVYSTGSDDAVAAADAACIDAAVHAVTRMMVAWESTFFRQFRISSMA